MVFTGSPGITRNRKNPSTTTSSRLTTAPPSFMATNRAVLAAAVDGLPSWSTGKWLGGAVFELLACRRPWDRARR
jgi:hypothetical protein